MNTIFHIGRCAYYKVTEFFEDQGQFIGALLIYTAMTALITNYFM